MLTKPPPLVQITQLVPTSSFNLKTTSQSSTATEKSSLTTFRRVQQHDERCNSNEIKHSTLQCIHVLVHSIFWLSQHQYTSHRPFWSLQPPPSYFDTYFSWSIRRRCEIELTELKKNWSFTMVRECFGLKIPTHRSKQRQQTCLSGRAFKNVDQRPPNGLFLNEKVSKWLTCRLFLHRFYDASSTATPWHFKVWRCTMANCLNRVECDS